MVGAFLVLDVFGLALLSRFAPRAGFVALRQTFVLCCQNRVARHFGRIRNHEDGPRPAA